MGAIREADTFAVIGSKRKIKAKDLVRRLYRCELCDHEVLTIGAELGLRRSGSGPDAITDAAVCYRIVRCPAAAHGWARCCGKFVQVKRGAGVDAPERPSAWGQSEEEA